MNSELFLDQLQRLVLAAGILLAGAAANFQRGSAGFIFPVFPIVLVEFVQARHWTTVAKQKNPVDLNAVPLAVDPAGRSVIVTGPIDSDTGKNVLWAWVAGTYEEGSPGNRLLNGHRAVVVSAAWANDGKTVASGDSSGRIIVWDAKTMKETSRLELGARVAALALSRDGKNIAAVVVGKLAEFYRWDIAKPTNGMKPIHIDSSDFSGPIHACLSFSPDGQQLTGSAINAAWLTKSGALVGKVPVWETVKP